MYLKDNMTIIIINIILIGCLWCRVCTLCAFLCCVNYSSQRVEVYYIRAHFGDYMLMPSFTTGVVCM